VSRRIRFKIELRVLKMNFTSFSVYCATVFELVLFWALLKKRSSGLSEG